MRHPPAPDCPYKGLEPYEEADLAYFFGRGDDAQRIANALMTAPLTVLYGKSGVGKSSVLKAAVPPRLRDPENTLVLLWNAWQSPAFLDDLLAALFKEASIEPSGDALDQVLPGLASNLGRPVALIFDQFEEYFHYREGPRDAFEQQLARLANSGHDDIHILLSLRDDGLASLDRLRRRIPQILRSRLELKHLTEDGAREAVDGPLGVFNKVHGATITIKPALRDRIIREVSSREPGGGLRIETAYLQLALTKFWEASGGARAKGLDAGTFDTLGGATDIARQHLEDVLNKLSPAERELAAVLFDRLVTPGGRKIALSATALAGYAKAAAALLGQAKTDGESVVALLQRLTRRENRLLRPVPSPDDPNVQGFELFHDVLGQPTRAWLERDAEVRKRAKELDDRARDLEVKRKRIYAFAAAIALIFGTVAMGAAFYAMQQFMRAQEETELVHIERVRALLEQSRAMASASQDELEHRNPRTAALLALRGLPDETNSRRPLFEPAQVALYKAVQRDWEEVALIGHAGVLRVLAFDPSGKRLATASLDGTARIWNSDTGALLHPLEGHAGPVLAVAFDPSGERLATASEDGTARIWNSDTGALLHQLEGHGGWLLAVAFDPSGERLATASADGTARIWNSETGALLQPIKGHGDRVLAVAFDPSGKRLATASSDGTARIWNSDTNELVQPLEGHRDWVLAVAFDPSGERLATASADGTARIWNSETGALLHPLEGHAGPVLAVAFDPSGERLATASSDGTARIWRVFQDVNELVAFAKRGHRRLCFIETERERYFIPEEEGCLERGSREVETEVKP